MMPGRLSRLRRMTFDEGRWRATISHPDAALRQIVETREFLVRGHVLIINGMAEAGGEGEIRTPGTR